MGKCYYHTQGRLEGGKIIWQKLWPYYGGLQVIKDIQIKEITIEGDSKLIIDMVKGISQPIWTIQTIITNIRKFLEGLERP